MGATRNDGLCSGPLHPGHGRVRHVEGVVDLVDQPAGELHGPVGAGPHVLAGGLLGHRSQSHHHLFQPHPGRAQRRPDLRRHRPPKPPAHVLGQGRRQLLPGAVETVHQLLVGHDRLHRPSCVGEAAGAEVQAEGGGDDVLQLVGLVDHHHVVVGEDGSPRLQVEPVQVQVHHHHVGLAGRRPGLLGETGPALRAPLGARALFGGDAHRRPRRRRRFPVQLGPVTGLAGLGPSGQSAQLRLRRPVGQAVEGELITAARYLGHPLPADVVGSALQHGEGKRRIEVTSQERKVLARQLVLQGLGGGGHHDPLARQDGRHQVGERLPRAGPSLHRQVPLLFDGAHHRLGHLDLAGAGLTATGQGGSDSAERDSHLRHGFTKVPFGRWPDAIPDRSSDAVWWPPWSWWPSSLSLSPPWCYRWPAGDPAVASPSG